MGKLTDSDKIGIIFSKVGKIETDVAVIKERYTNTEKRLNAQEGKLAAIDEVIISYKTERAKLIGIAVAAGTIFGALGSFIIWIVGLFYKHN